MFSYLQMLQNLTHRAFKSILEVSLQSVQEAKQQQEIALAIDRELESDYFYCITSPFLSAMGKANKDKGEVKQQQHESSVR